MYRQMEPLFVVKLFDSVRIFHSVNDCMMIDEQIGILPMMCKEMLDTRIMIKRAMKRHKGEPGSSVLHKVLDARQLAVKLLSNVTCQDHLRRCYILL